MKTKTCTFLSCLLFSVLAAPQTGQTQPKIYMQDTPADTGVEPNPDTDPMWVSQDIWIRNNAISGYTPYPYASGSPPAWVAANPHQNPIYRDPLLSQPNYVYVRVRNIGSSPSTGTEQLHVYWAKASTGLSWSNQWVDYMASYCGPSALYGIEITKPRRNLADTNVPQSEVDNYINAINAIATTAAYEFPDGVQYWYKQNTEHWFVASEYGGTVSFSAHGSDGFLPWHREYLNRYEILLRQAFPTVTLFYWDWTTDPTKAPQSTRYAALGGFNGGIGSYYATVTPPAWPGGTLDPGEPVVSRFTGKGLTPESTTDATILAEGTLSDFAAWDEGRGGVSDEAHNWSHGFIGGTDGSGYPGNMSVLTYAAQDPFFFLLHGNVDKLWSEWQRQNPSSQSRYDPATAYTGTMNTMNQPMAPWNGFEHNGSVGTIPAPKLRPWTTGDGYICMKDANDHSVVYPPIYDTAPLTIPVLQPGQVVVIEIPWYPPNPATYSCFGADKGHVCLLARIETNTTYPYGMTFPEGTSGNDLYTNVQNNNKIVWKNVDIVTGLPGPLMVSPVWLRNILLNGTTMQLSLGIPTVSAALPNYGTVYLNLESNLFNKWLQNGAVQQNFEIVGNGPVLQLVGTNGTVGNIPLASNEVDQVQVEFNLNNGYANPQGQVFNVDLEQYNQVAGAGNQLVGGQRFSFDFNHLCLVAQGSTWRYEPTNLPAQNWNQVGYNDSNWMSGAAKLGYGVGDENTVVDSGPSNAPYITTYFRYDFTLQNLSLYSNLWLQLEAYDGAVVYLNGMEIQRLRMPTGAITPTTLASATVTGLAAETFYAFNVSSYLSQLSASNVLAVEVHLGDPNGTDMGFDCALNANLAGGSGGGTNFPPQVAFLSPTNGNIFPSGQNVQLTATAIDPLYSIASISFYVDGQLIGTSTGPTYTTAWNNAPPGTHQLMAVATDAAGLTGNGYASVQVMNNVPPTITITSPPYNAMYVPNAPITFSSAVQKTGVGTIQKVDFSLMAHGMFNTPVVPLGTATAAPYQIQFAAPANPGPYMLTAVATDSAGVRSYSVPVMIMVLKGPSLTISYVPPNVIINWIPSNAVLQQSYSVTGPWLTLSNVIPPYQFFPTNYYMYSNTFFRAFAP